MEQKTQSLDLLRLEVEQFEEMWANAESMSDEEEIFQKRFDAKLKELETTERELLAFFKGRTPVRRVLRGVRGEQASRKGA